MTDKILIGSHVSMGSPKFYLGSVEEAISYGSTTFMFYTGAPQNTIRKPLEELRITEARQLLKEHGFDESKIIVHAPYIVNPANTSKPDLFDMSKNFILKEVQRTSGFGAGILVLHPGAHVGAGPDVGIASLVKALDYIFDNDDSNVKIALETMAGKGTEIGITFEQIAQIISSSKHPDRLGVCLDTCHINDAGYNVKDIDSVLDEFDKVIGLDKLLVIHINDSKNEKGARKDRHENLGYGHVGFETIYKIVHHPKLVNIPKILETPYINDKPPYKKEISMLLTGDYEDNWRDNF